MFIVYGIYIYCINTQMNIYINAFVFKRPAKTERRMCISVNCGLVSALLALVNYCTVLSCTYGIFSIIICYF